MTSRGSQRRQAIVTSSAKATFRHNSQRHGSCTNRSLGKCSQRRKVNRDIRTAAAPAQAISDHQRLEFRLRHFRVNHIAAATVTISAKATRETRKLKRL